MERTGVQTEAERSQGSLSASSGFLQRQCACGTHMMGGGQCAECQKKKMGVGGRPLQTKLAISEPGDAYEQEADRVADQVMQMSPTGLSSRRKSGMTQPLIQRRATAGATGLAEASPSVHGVLNSPGQSLEPVLRQDMEHRFNHDFSQVRVHTDGAAVRSAREVNAHAYTVGHHVVFARGAYSSDTPTGQHLLAHELTHVVQQEVSGSSGSHSAPQILQRFGSEEHVRIGSVALPGRDVLIVGYGRVSYGEMIAMIGDYFGSLVEMQSLARMGRFGTQQIDLARWKVNPSLPRPSVDSGVEEAVDGRYTRLASRNETHFSTGSAPGRSNREQYIAAHTIAIRAAYNEGLMPLTIGLGWAAQEAASNHFLTDAFSAGHVRTPRGQIQGHWGALYPNFSNDLVRTISCYMASFINDRDNVGYLVTVNYLSGKIEPVIRAQGGSALSSFSISDLISKVMHDADNAGLDVVSPRGPAGTTTGSPFRWRAVGDDFLFSSTPNAAAAQTQQMVQEAVVLSFEEARQAFSAGSSANSSMLATLVNPANFRALSLLPVEDTASTTNPTYSWRVARIEDLPTNLQALLIAAFAPGTEIRRRIDSLPVPETYEASGFSLHTGDAWDCFTRLLLADPFGMVTRICNGNVCPPGRNNPCP
ncbi:MAG: DUF4157 domain-containing protein [Nitrospira sp.]|nr:DUF4157 domain-containing protein [Nitrospira sp.]